MTHDRMCLCAEDSLRCADCWEDCACGCFDIRRVRPMIINAALDAAREAVVRLQHKPGASIVNAVSAIDALSENLDEQQVSENRNDAR